jgi:hypothetical protein
MIVVPGQGESTVANALQLEPRQAATAISNLLGVWIDDTASVEASQVAAVTDDTTGVEIGGDTTGGAEVASMLGEPDPGGTAALQIVLKALAQAGASWDAADLAEATTAGTSPTRSRPSPARTWSPCRRTRSRVACSARAPSRWRRGSSTRSGAPPPRRRRSSC